MVRILVINKENNCVNQIAAAWLQSFNNDMLVVTSGVIGATDIDPEVVKAMKEVKAAWANINLESFDESIKENWDYVFIINHCIEPKDARFIGNVLHWNNLQLKEEESLHETNNLTYEQYISIRDSLRYQVFQTYLTAIGGKEMLGSDSCGVECDLY